MEPKAAPPKPERTRVLQPEPRPVAERERLDVVVVETPAAEPATQTDATVFVPQRVGEKVARPRRVPVWYWLLARVTAGVLLVSWRVQHSPFIVRAEHALQGWVLGERNYDAPQSVLHAWPRKG